MNFKHQFIIAAALIATGASVSAQVTKIDETKALAGGITAGDTAGYPITLSTSGHYQLQSDLVVPNAAIGIHVAADNVTIDLNGYAIRGSASCARDASSYLVTCSNPNATGISGNGAAALIVRNGRVQGFTYGMSVNPHTTVQNVVITGNQFGLQTNSSPGSRGITRLLRTHVMLNETGANFATEGAVVMDSVFSRNGKAVSGTGSNLAVANSSVVSNMIGFWTGEFGLNGVFLRDNKTNNTATVFTY